MTNASQTRGLDSPLIIAGFLVVGTIALTDGLLRPHFYGLAMRWIGIIAGAYCLQGAASLVYYSKAGKLRMREEFLNSIPWRGDATVLDVGCGRGLLMVAAAHRLTTGQAVGVDVWLPKAVTGNRPNSALENATLEGVRDRVEVTEADARKLPFPDASFDIVVSNFVLHEMTTDADREKMVQEDPCAEAGGYVALTDFIFTDTCVEALRQNGVQAKRERVGSLSCWIAAILNFGFFQLYHVTGRRAP